jgi:hypothetical protein
MLRIAPGRGGAGVYFVAGGELGYMLAAETTTTGEGSSEDYEISEGFGDFDYGVCFGLGFQTRNSRGSSFFFESRYSWGLANIVKDSPEQQASEDYGVSTRGIYILGGMRF